VSARRCLRRAQRRLRAHGARLDDAARSELVEAIDALDHALHAPGAPERREAARRLAARRLAGSLHRHLPRRPVEVLREWLLIILAAVLVAFALKHSVLEPYSVPTLSMAPALKAQDRIMVSKCAYDVWLPFTRVRLARVREPRRWDVIVFTTRHIPDASAAPRNFVKRVVGLPGETLEIRQGDIYVNDALVPKPPFLADSCYYLNTPEGRTSMLALGNAKPDGAEREVLWRYGKLHQRFTVPQGHYFVLGDNSSASLDGRCWGFVPRRDVRGRVVCRWRFTWPFYGGPVN